MIAFGTVVYSEALVFLDEFIDSINGQLFNEFELLIVNDGVDTCTLMKYTQGIRINYTVFDNYEKKTPAVLRADLLHYAKNKGVELLILGDCDDLFDCNRVLEMVNEYRCNSEYAFYYNKLKLFDKSEALKEMPCITDNVDKILEYNYLGMSNTALNMSFLTNQFIESLYLFRGFVFDWYLFSRIVCEGGKGKLIDNTSTFYRIHANNYAGVSARKQFKKEYDVKHIHYESMAKYNEVYAVLLSKLESLDFDAIYSCESPSYWWNNIRLG